MKLAIVDDERAQCQLLEEYMKEALTRRGIREPEITCFTSSAGFLEGWKPGAYDLILLDIYIDTLNGVQIAQRIRQRDENVMLVFCTSSNEFATQSYEVNARYYLQKPVTPEKISRMLDRIDLERMKSARIIQLPDGFRVLLRRLMYTNYVNHVVTFYFHGMESHSLYITQSQVEQLLAMPGFYAPNKGSIVNLAMVRKVTSDSFLMKDDQLIPIARRRYKEAREAYTRFHFRQLCEEAEE